MVEECHGGETMPTPSKFLYTSFVLVTCCFDIYLT